MSQPLTLIVIDDAAIPSTSNPIFAKAIPLNSSTAPPCEPCSYSDHNYGMMRPPSPPMLLDSLTLDGAGFRQFITGINLPSSDWNWSFNEKSKNLLCSAHQFQPDGALIIKTIKILNSKEVKFFINGKSVLPSNLASEFRNKEALAQIICSFDSRRPCEGFFNQSLEAVEVSKTCSGIREGNIWWSIECTKLSEIRNLCNKCRCFKKTLLKKSKYTPKPKDPLKAKRKLATVRRALKRMTRRVEVIFLHFKNQFELNPCKNCIL